MSPDRRQSDQQIFLPFDSIIRLVRFGREAVVHIRQILAEAEGQVCAQTV